MNEVSAALYHMQVIEPCSLSQLQGYICPDRLERLSKLQHPQARACSLTGDLLLHVVVQNLFPEAHFPLTRKTTQSGKPYLPDYPAFHFSLSHSGNLVVCAVSSVPIGVDLERERPVRPGIAARWFTPEEQNLLASDPSAFFDLWMAKEAVLKEIGCGLCGELKNVSVQLSPAPHLTAPVHDTWHALTRVLLPAQIPVMIAIPGTQPAHVTVHPITPQPFL